MNYIDLRINGLESKVFVVKVTDEQTLSSESIRLDVDIGSGDASQETRFSNIGVSADQQGSCGGINGGKTAKMLADLVEI